MYMKKIWLILLAGFCASCCTTPSGATRWTKAELSNTDLSLIDDRLVLEMGFDHKVQFANVTMGFVGGPLTPPLFYARIDSRGVLILSEANDSRTVFEITKLSERGKMIDVSIHEGIKILGGTKWDGKVWVLQRLDRDRKSDTEPQAATSRATAP